MTLLPKLPEPYQECIARKSGSIRSLQLLWESAATKLIAIAHSKEVALSLLEGFRNPRNLEALANGLAAAERSPEAFLDSLRSMVDVSAYSLEAWFEGVEAMQAYLARTSRKASPSSILGYVSCCAEMGGNGSQAEALPALVESMLEQYGFEGQEGCVL